MDEIVARLEASCRNAEGRARNIYGDSCDEFAVIMPSLVRTLISDWRRRGEERDVVRAELDVLSASHKDLAHRLARMGEELAEATEANEQAVSYAEMVVGDRNSARALLRETVPHIERAMIPYKDGWIDEKRYILARIAKELGPTREDEPEPNLEWPALCQSPSSCSRHGRCMYTNCAHDGIDLTAEMSEGR